MTRQTDVEYIIGTPINYTCTHLADHLDGDISHDPINDYFREMLRLAFEEKRIEAQTILFDNWYASSENIKYIHRLGKFFITPLKENRLISLSKEQGYIHLR